MTDPTPFTKVEGAGKGPIIFGKDVSEIPCFRNSWLYGISVGLFGGLMTFMGTSRPQLATKSGCVYIIGTTIGYWIYCRYHWMQEFKTSQQIKEYIKAHNDGNVVPPSGKQDPQPDIEIVTVSNIKN